MRQTKRERNRHATDPEATSGQPAESTQGASGHQTQASPPPASVTKVKAKRKR